MDELEKVLEFRRNLNKLNQSPVKAGGYISPLESDILKTKSLASPLADEAKDVIKGVTDHINTKDIQKLIPGNQFQDKIAAILESRAASKAARALSTASEFGRKIPMLGGLALGVGTALATGDANAAIPILNEADAVGPEQGSLAHKLESGAPLTDEEKMLLERRK